MTFFYMSGTDCVLSSCFFYGFVSRVRRRNIVPVTKSIRNAAVQVPFFLENASVISVLFIYFLI